MVTGLSFLSHLSWFNFDNPYPVPSPVIQDSITFFIQFSVETRGQKKIRKQKKWKRKFPETTCELQCSLWKAYSSTWQTAKNVSTQLKKIPQPGIDYFIILSISVQIILTFFINDSPKFKYQPSHLNVKTACRWTMCVMRWQKVLLANSL